MLGSGSAFAASNCLKGDSLNKLCLDITSIPGDTVQPSGEAGTKTYVKYTITLRNVVSSTSRNILVNVSFSPAPPSALDVAFSSGLACTVGASTINCMADKIDRVDPLTITAVVEAPTYPTTASQMIASGVFGWNGNTATTTQNVTVSDTGARSYVPANTEVTLVTAPETANEDDQVDASHPLFGKATLPPQPVAYYAQLSVVGGPAPACTGGLFLAVTDGGPYVCRNSGTPYVQFDVGGTPGTDLPAYFTAANPVDFTIIWDAGRISPLQLPPTAAAPTGTPAFPVFYTENDTIPPPVRAFSKLCSDTGNVPPCLTSVEKFANGDWRASGLKATDGSDMVAAASPLAPLYAVLDFLVGKADATPIKPPILG